MKNLELVYLLLEEEFYESCSTNCPFELILVEFGYHTNLLPQEAFRFQ